MIIEHANKSINLITYQSVFVLLSYVGSVSPFSLNCFVTHSAGLLIAFLEELCCSNFVGVRALLVLLSHFASSSWNRSVGGREGRVARAVEVVGVNRVRMTGGVAEAVAGHRDGDIGTGKDDEDKSGRSRAEGSHFVKKLSQRRGTKVIRERRDSAAIQQLLKSTELAKTKREIIDEVR